MIEKIEEYETFHYFTTQFFFIFGVKIINKKGRISEKKISNSEYNFGDKILQTFLVILIFSKLFIFYFEGFPILSESRSTDFHKIINEAFYATDDLDGEATAQDDQEMTFVKVRTDLTGVTDVISILLNQVRLLADSSTVSDSGSLRSQGYVSFDYMAEDFVGASRTF